MKKTTSLCLALSLALLLFAGGCGRGDNNNTGTVDNDMNDTPGTNDTTGGGTTNTMPGGTTPDNSTMDNSTAATGNGTDDHMTTLQGLIGKADDELIRAFGEGEAMLDQGLTTGRSYTMNIFGEEMPVHVALDQKGNVVSADASLPDNDEERWNQALTDAFGEPITVTGDGADDRPQWIKDGTIYAIERENDKLALRISGDTAAG